MAKKSAEIGLRQAGRLTAMPKAERLAVIAEGLPIILTSAQSLEAASISLKNFPREADLLAGLSDEEAGKALILLDLVRCPEKLSAKYIPKLIKAFYSHLARLIYVEVCHWRPSTVAELQGYVDHHRQSHHVDGPTGADFVFPNWALFEREARLYADLCRDGDGGLSWNQPLGLNSGLLRMRSSAVRVVEALELAGAFKPSGVNIVAEVWQAHLFEGEQHASLSDELIQATLVSLMDAGLASSEFTNEHVQTVYRYWQIPMYAIDFRMVPVTFEEIEAQREVAFHNFVGW